MSARIVALHADGISHAKIAAIVSRETGETITTGTVQGHLRAKRLAPPKPAAKRQKKSKAVGARAKKEPSTTLDSLKRTVTKLERMFEEVDEPTAATKLSAEIRQTRKAIDEAEQARRIQGDAATIAAEVRERLKQFAARSAPTHAEQPDAGPQPVPLIPRAAVG